MIKEGKTFYPDLSKNHDLVNGLNKILNKKESSISMCYIKLNSSNQYILFFHSLKNDSLSLTFNFHTSSDILEEEYHPKYIKQGFNKEDLELLSQFLSNFALSNIYESCFFGSLFFVKEFRDFTPCYILKYDISEEQNRFLIDGMKLSRHYSLTSKDNIKDAITKESYRSNENSKLIAFNTYMLQDNIDLKRVIEKFSQLKNKEDFIIVEYYRSYETNEGFLKNIFKLDGENLKEININD